MAVQGVRGHVSHGAEPGARGADQLAAPRGRAPHDELFVGAREHDATVEVVPQQHEADVLVLAHARPDVFVQHGVQHHHRATRLDRGRVFHHARQRALGHQRDEASEEPVTGDVADRDPGTIGR